MVGSIYITGMAKRNHQNSTIQLRQKWHLLRRIQPQAPQVVSPEPGHLQGHWADDVIFLSGDEFSTETAWSQLTSSVQTVAKRFLGSPNRFSDSQIKWEYFLWKQDFSFTINNLFSMQFFWRQ